MAGDWVKQVTDLELQDYYTFTKVFYNLMLLNFPFKIFSMFKSIGFFVLEKKTDILILKRMIKNL